MADRTEELGRWGADDERGASNLITPAKSLNAAKLAKTGMVVSLASQIQP